MDNKYYLVVLSELFQDKSLSTGIFFLELLSAVEPRVVNWNLVTKGETGMHVRYCIILGQLEMTCYLCLIVFFFPFFIINLPLYCFKEPEYMLRSIHDDFLFSLSSMKSR